jgi:DNA-binding PadR family transcriptional regulator
MYELQSFQSPFPGLFAARRFRRGRFRGHGSGGGRHGRGMDGDDMMRAGRLLAQGDIRLIALALIAEEPRHGYEIIKVLEDRTSGWYSPSPGIVYPTLTFLEETGYVTAQADGAKKLYSITAEGRAHLAANRDFVTAVLERFDALGERVQRMRRRERDDESERGGPEMSRSVRGAFADLGEAARELLGNDRDANMKIIAAIERATAELRRR